MKGYKKMFIAGATIFLIGLIIFIVFLGLNGWHFDGNFEMQTYECKEKISELKIDFSAGTLVTEYVDDDKITVEYPENDDFTTEFEVKNGTLRLHTTNTHWFNFIWLGRIPTTTVKIPKGTVLNLDLDMSAGTVTLAEAAYGNVSIHLSAGTLNMQGAVCSDFKCHLSAGTANLKTVECAKFQTKISAGTVNVSDITCPDVSVHISAGTANLKINGRKSDYTILVDKSAGSCNVSSQSGGSKRIDADISAGTLNISFTN